jgi:replicative DNA helicase
MVDERTKTEHEKIVLGSILLLGKLPPRISAKLFTTEPNAIIFNAIQTLYFNNNPIDIVSICDEVKRMGKNEIINTSYIASLTNIIPSAANVDYYIDQLLTAYDERHILTALKTAVENIEKGKDYKEIVNDVLPQLYAQTKTEQKRLATAESYFTECERYDPSKDFKPSLFCGLNCPNGTLSYIGARPGGGKTTAMINIAREAINAGRRVFFVNLEMTNKQIITNFILSMMYATHGGKSLDSVNEPLNAYYSLYREGTTINNSDFVEARVEALNVLKESLNKNLFIYDGIGNKMGGLLLDIRAHTREGDVVLLDYVQRLPIDEKDQRYLQIKEGSNAILQAAIQGDLVVISGAQFNREAQKEGQEATLAMFREGGDIEADAHNALSIENAYIKVLKAREGKSGSKVTLIWKKEYCYMEADDGYTGIKAENEDKAHFSNTQTLEDLGRRLKK